MKELISVKQMQNAEQLVFESGTSELELMARAVDGIFQHIDLCKNTLIVCGYGNNGGDGLGLAVKMAENKLKVSVLLLSNKLKECGRYYLNKCREFCVKIYDDENLIDFNGYDQIIDCIFGIGFHGELDDKTKNIVNKINLSGSYVISVDIPSGINGNNGVGDIAVQSHLTVAVGALKYGNLLNDAKDHCKKAVVCDIGIDKNTNCFLFETDDAKKILAQRKHNSHKGNYGYVGLIGGSIKYSGAVKLANLSLTALKCGAGVSRLIVPDCISQSVLPYLTVSTLETLPSASGSIKFDAGSLDNALKKLSALSVGMGMTDSEETEKVIEYILKNCNFNLIIDADGLNALSRLDKKCLRDTDCKVVLTPHILEFSRLSNLSREQILLDPIGCAVNFAKEYGVILLLKGTATIVTDGEKVLIVNRGTSGMATAGSGDVLSGILCGLLGYNKASPEIVALGAYINGVAGEMAGEKYGDISMTAENTTEFIASVIKNITKIA